MSRICSAPGCFEAVPYGRCPAHQRQPRDRTRYDRDRGSAARRGYDRAWRTFRERVLSQRPVCADCEAAGFVAAAEHLHHVEKLTDAPHRRLDERNVLPLCARCHQRRTARGE